jgi:hypothetical protein
VEAAALEQHTAHSGEDGAAGAGGPCVAPPCPSAKAMAEMEAARRQLAKNRAGFVICFRPFSWNGRGDNGPSNQQMLLSAQIIALLAIVGARSRA